MNDQQFERDTEALRHRGYVSFVEAVRARDTAQREALAQLQAEMPDLRANMTKALDLLQVLTSTKYTHRAFVEAVDEADEMLEQLRGKVVMKGLADQQEAQGALAGDEHENFEAWHRSVVAGDPPHEKYHDGSYVNQHVNRYWTGWQARAALATQPAAGEPVYQPKDEAISEIQMAIAASPDCRAHGLTWDEAVALYDAGYRKFAPPAAAHGDEAVAQEPKKETVCRNCFRNPEQIAKCLSYDCNVYEREAVSAMRAQGDGEAKA